VKYSNFLLRIGPGEGGSYAVEVASPKGEGRGTFTLPRDLSTAPAAEPLTEAGAPRDLIARPSPAIPLDARQDARQVGIELFQSLFAGEVASLFHASLSSLPGQGHGLRIQLEIDARRPELAMLQDLPWELLCRRDTEDVLCLDRRTPVVRSLYAHREHRPPIPGSEKLRILAVAANPSDSLTLELEQEFLNLAAAWKGREREVEVVLQEGGGREELRRAFLAAPFQVLHFMGHGQFDEAAGRGAILLEDGAGAAHRVGGRDLAEELQGFESLRLVVLNACQTARSVGERGPDPFGGVATAQVMSGVPVVIAMRRPIPDAAAVAFSRVLYERLADGDPVEAAVTEARLAIRRLPRSSDSDHWATPVLFLRGPDGSLFAPAPEPRFSSRLRLIAVAVLAAALALVLGMGWVRARRASEVLRHNQEGIALMSQGRTGEARREFLTALRADPRSSAAHANLSALEERQGSYDQALAHARAAAESAPGEAVHHYNLGNLLVLLGREEEALGSLRRAVELDPAYAPALNELGNVYLRLDRPAEARQALESGLRADPTLAPLHKNLARTDLAEGRAAEAVGRLEKALSLYSPEDSQGIAESLYWLAVAENRAGRREASCRRLEDLLERQPGEAGPWAGKARELAQQIRCESVS
jgi:tetratricopeptide (TPR) repeat protein